MDSLLPEGEPSTRAVDDPFLVLAIATAGRRDLLSSVMAQLASQTTYPDIAIVCGAGEDDVDRRSVARLPFPTVVIEAEKGLCVQRNAVLDLLEERWPNAELLVFLDDDFVPAPDFLSQAVRLARRNPDVVLATGHVLKDGIKGVGIPLTEALVALADDRTAKEPGGQGLSDVYNVYGCNMLLRLQPIRRQGARFDVNLPLYSWLEDVEFSRALAASGRIVRSGMLRGVHLGAKCGRTPGAKFGYSQVANPLYLRRKGRMSARRALVRVARNLLANTVRVLRPEPWVDRRGRLAGNIIALGDLFAGRLSPARILDLE